MELPTVKIGDREFKVPEFSIKQQRIVTPALMKVAGNAQDISDPKAFGDMLDVVYLCLTIGGANEITKDEFEDLKTGALHIAANVLPVILKAAGLQPEQAGAPAGGAGTAAPSTPLNGETTSTT